MKYRLDDYIPWLMTYWRVALMTVTKIKIRFYIYIRALLKNKMKGIFVFELFWYPDFTLNLASIFFLHFN